MSGDANAFAEIVERYGSRVYNLALRITGDRDAANDCAQDAFIRAYRALSQYDPALPLHPWLFRIATNTSLNHVQRWHAHEHPVEELPDRPEPEERNPEAIAVRREEVGEVLAAMTAATTHSQRHVRACVVARRAITASRNRSGVGSSGSR